MKLEDVFITGYKLMLLGFVLYSCTPQPEPIKYGEDKCYYCMSTIMDRLHAAEMVTKSKKIYKFDAIECMVKHIKEVDCSQVESFLVCDFKTGTQLIKAGEATYLISNNLPSPQGGNIAAFKLKEQANQFYEKKKGNLYTWNELLKNVHSNLR